MLKTLSIGKAAPLRHCKLASADVDNVHVPLDNNATERGIRGPVVGRKNDYGSKSKSGTEIAATLYTLLETAKLHDVDPARYLLEAALRSRSWRGAPSLAPELRRALVHARVGVTPISFAMLTICRGEPWT